MEQFAELFSTELGLLEVDCFLLLAIASNYGVLCIVAANGDLGCFA